MEQSPRVSLHACISRSPCVFPNGCTTVAHAGDKYSRRFLALFIKLHVNLHNARRNEINSGATLLHTLARPPVSPAAR